MTDFQQICVGPLETNCYLVWDKNKKKAAVIDPGGDEDLIAKQVVRLEINVEWVLITHGHLDHCFSAGIIARKYDAEIGMHPADIEHLTNVL